MKNSRVLPPPARSALSSRGITGYLRRRARLIILLVSVLAGHDVLPAATLTATYFGFDTNAADNYSAMQRLGNYASTNRSVSVAFAPGRYMITMSSARMAACLIAGATNVLIDAPAAEFFSTNLNTEGYCVFAFISCTNVTLNARFRGLHSSGDSSRDGLTSVLLLASNNTARLNVTTLRMFDGVRIGGLEDPAFVSRPVYEGNRNITVTATNVDTYYGVPAYLADGLTITNVSVGTSSNGFCAHRSVYLIGCTNALAYSYSRDLNVPDGCNIIGTTPAVVPPYHFGSSNITLYATDLGSTNNALYQSLVKLQVVTSSVTNISTGIKRIRIHVTAPSTATVRTNSFTVDIGSLGSQAAHRYEDITISGTVARGPFSTAPTMVIDTADGGLAYLQITLADYHETVAPSRYTFYDYSPLSTVMNITAEDSDVNGFYFPVPADQTFQNLGYLPPPLPASDVHVIGATLP